VIDITLARCEDGRRPVERLNRRRNCPAIPTASACSTALRQASSCVAPRASIRFSPLMPVTIQTNPDFPWTATSPTVQPAAWRHPAAGFGLCCEVRGERSRTPGHTARLVRGQRMSWPVPSCAINHPQLSRFRGWNSAASLITPTRRSFGTTTDQDASPPKKVVMRVLRASGVHKVPFGQRRASIAPL
jgi:hypothetical protein